jgi:predicted alpha/beta-fold hydrolase
MLRFKPAHWLKNAHLQTLYPALFRKNPTPPQLHRERLFTPDHDFIDIDICGTGTAPLVILLHGLTGSSQSSYIKGLQAVLLRHGFRSVALNFRGCSGEYNRLARCYHSGETDDVHFLYQTLRQCEPNTPMAAIGFSLGGSVLLNWLGKYGEQISLFAAVGISVPLVLSVCATKLDHGFSQIYRGVLLRELRHFILAKQRHLLKIGAIEEANKIKQLGDLSSIHSFWQYDDRVVAPLHGFHNVHDYYKRSSARQFLKSITVPTLLIQSLDDPFMTPDVLPRADELSPTVKLEMTQNGGHVGFVAGKSLFKPVYWLEKRILVFLKQQLSRS